MSEVREVGEAAATVAEGCEDGDSCVTGGLEGERLMGGVGFVVGGEGGIMCKGGMLEGLFGRGGACEDGELR